MGQSMYKGIFSSDKEYPSLSVVTYNDTETESTVAVQVLMISCQPVPVGSDIKDANYWLPYNVENVNMLGAKNGLTYDEVAKMIQESEVDIRADIADLKQRVELLEQEQEALSGTVEQHETRLTKSEDEIENLDTEMATAQADILDLKNKPDYELPIASGVVLGGVKVGDGLSVASDGTLSASGGGGSGVSYAKIEIPDITALTESTEITGSVSGISSGSITIVREGNVVSAQGEYQLSSTTQNGNVSVNVPLSKVKEFLGITTIKSMMTLSAYNQVPNFAIADTTKPFTVEAYDGVVMTLYAAPANENDDELANLDVAMYASSGGENDYTYVTFGVTGVIVK